MRYFKKIHVDTSRAIFGKNDSSGNDEISMNICGMSDPSLSLVIKYDDYTTKFSKCQVDRSTY